MSDPITTEQIGQAASPSVLLLDRGELYVSAEKPGEFPEVWSNGGARIARFMYRGDAEAFVAVFNLLQQVGAAGVAINGYEIGADGNIARVTSRSRDGDKW